jgi:aminoglycoside/choline kinase family phosphotransferase
MERQVGSFVRRRFGSGAVVEPLAGDASDRSFFRIRIPGLASLVAMVHPEPFRLEDLPYFQHARFLREIGADVPAIVSSYPGEGILLLQDLGDETLMSCLEGVPPERRHFLYRHAVQIIVSLQQEGTPALTADLPAARTALDTDRFLFELRHFFDHYVQSLLGAPLSRGESVLLEDWFVELAAAVAGYPAVLCHRDFHSRNLMLRGDRLYMVDIQDARMGPFLYDLASLLRDAYVDLPEELVEEMFEFFLEASGRTGDPESPSHDEALAQFEMTSLQRCIKAVGTFAYQATVRRNRSYLPCIPRALAHVRANLARRGLDEILRLFQGSLKPPASWAS